MISQKGEILQPAPSCCLHLPETILLLTTPNMSDSWFSKIWKIYDIKFYNGDMYWPTDSLFYNYGP